MRGLPRCRTRHDLAQPLVGLHQRLLELRCRIPHDLAQPLVGLHQRVLELRCRISHGLDPPPVGLHRPPLVLGSARVRPRRTIEPYREVIEPRRQMVALRSAPVRAPRKVHGPRRRPSRLLVAPRCLPAHGHPDVRASRGSNQAPAAKHPPPAHLAAASSPRNSDSATGDLDRR